jgi:hypothetical protein
MVTSYGKDYYMADKPLNQALSRRQLENKRSFWAPLLPSTEIIQKTESLSGVHHKLMGYMLAFANRHSDIYIRQDTIAAKLGYRRESINRALGALQELGLIKLLYRHMTSCKYKIASAFFNFEVRSELRHIYKCLFFIPIAFLMPYLQGVDHPLVKDSYIYSKKHGYSNKSHNEIIRIYNIPRENNPLVRVADRWRASGGGSGNKKWISAGGKESPMEVVQLSRVKSLNLTPAGMIKLSGFPPEARDQAMRELRSHKGSVGDIFRYYSTLCHRYCKERGIVVPWKMIFAALEREAFHRDSPGLDAQQPLIYESASQRPAVREVDIPKVKTETAENWEKNHEILKGRIAAETNPFARSVLEFCLQGMEASRKNTVVDLPITSM